MRHLGALNYWEDLNLIRGGGPQIPFHTMKYSVRKTWIRVPIKKNFNYPNHSTAQLFQSLFNDEIKEM